MSTSTTNITCCDISVKCLCRVCRVYGAMNVWIVEIEKRCSRVANALKCAFQEQRFSNTNNSLNNR